MLLAKSNMDLTEFNKWECKVKRFKHNEIREKDKS